ncbi:MAG: hypothetical protein M3498_02705 [Deinococcota bacterium]|nr:hypothetical protein [Deinococcota bacterium]
MNASRQNNRQNNKQRRHLRLALGLAALVLFAVGCTQAGPNGNPPLAPALTTVLEPVTVGNVFFEDERVRVRVNASGSAAVWTLRDIRGVVVAQGRAAMRGGRNAGSTTLELRLPKGERGFYRLYVEVMRGNAVVETAETTLAVLSRHDFSGVAADHSIFAAQTHFGQFPEIRPEYDPETQSYVTPGVPKHGPEMVPLLEMAGVRMVRDELPWSAVEPPAGETRGAYAFPESYDQYMNALDASGVSSLTILNYGNRLYDFDEEGIGSIPFTDDGRAGYAAYALALKERYPHIAEFEVWNEINAALPNWNRGPCRNSPPLNDYAITCHYELIKNTYETVKAAHPDMLVTGPAGVTLPYGYLDAIFEKGALDFLDAVTVHPYATNAAAPEFAYGNPAAGFIGTSLEDRARQLRNLMAQYGGGDKRIYFSELGWPTGSANNTVSELSQAKYLTRAYVLSLAANVDKMFWYDFVNDGIEDDRREQNFGLVRAKNDPLGAYTPKPAYVAYAAAARQLTGARFVGKDGAPAGVMSYVFERGGQDLRVMWLPEDTNVNTASKTISLEATSALTVTDMVGKTKTYTPVDGQVFLTLSGDPLYVEGSVTNVAEGAAIRLEPGDADAPLVLVVDNTGGSEPLHAIFRLEGENRSYPVLAPAGEVVRQPVTLSGATGLRTVYADVTVRGGLAASLYLRVYVVNPEDLPFPANALYGDTFPSPGTRGETLQGDPPELDSSGLNAVYAGAAPAQFVVDSTATANAVNDGATGVLRVAPPANADVTLVLPAPERRFAAEVDLVPFSGTGSDARNVGLYLTSTPENNFFGAGVSVRFGIGMTGNTVLRAQQRGGANHTVPVSDLAGYSGDNWNTLRLEVDLDASTVEVFFNGTLAGEYAFVNLGNVTHVGLEAHPGNATATAYLDTFSVSPLESGE